MTRFSKLEAALLSHGVERVRQDVIESNLHKGDFDDRLRRQHGHTPITKDVARVFCCAEGLREYIDASFKGDTRGYATVAEVLDTLDKPFWRNPGANVRYFRALFIYQSIIGAILWQEIQYLCPYIPTNDDCVKASFRLANECDKLVALLTEA